MPGAAALPPQAPANPRTSVHRFAEQTAYCPSLSGDADITMPGAAPYTDVCAQSDDAAHTLPSEQRLQEEEPPQSTSDSSASSHPLLHELAGTVGEGDAVTTTTAAAEADALAAFDAPVDALLDAVVTVDADGVATVEPVTTTAPVDGDAEKVTDRDAAGALAVADKDVDVVGATLPETAPPIVGLTVMETVVVSVVEPAISPPPVDGLGETDTVAEMEMDAAAATETVAVAAAPIVGDTVEEMVAAPPPTAVALPVFEKDCDLVGETVAVTEEDAPRDREDVRELVGDSVVDLVGDSVGAPPNVGVVVLVFVLDGVADAVRDPDTVPPSGEVVTLTTGVMEEETVGITSAPGVGVADSGAGVARVRMLAPLAT